MKKKSQSTQPKRKIQKPKKEAKEDPQIPMIGASKAPVRFFGSGALPRTRNGDGDVPDPKGGGTPIDPISVPDLAIQFLICLPATADRKDIHDQIQNALRKTMPLAEVRGPLCVNGTDRIGIWVRPPSGAGDAAARDRGLNRLAILQPGQLFTAFINSSLIRTQVRTQADKRGSRLNESGQPDPNGSVILSSIALSFVESSKSVVVTIDGTYTALWPDADFRITVTDTLSIVSGEVSCTTKQDLSVDHSLLDILVGLTTVLTLGIPQLFLIPVILLEVDLVIVATDAPNIAGTGGAGCAAARSFPRELLLKMGMKIQFFYTGIRVTEGGLFAGGDFMVVPRQPKAFIRGPTQVSVDKSEAGVTVDFFVVTPDMRGTRQFTWSGDGTVIAQNGANASILFALNRSGQPRVVSKTVSVLVKDEDGLTATNSFTIKIFRVTPKPEISPLCRAKPWLDQCKQ